jgi:hypothetical protein
MWNYWLARARESSTWRGVVLLATAAGVTMDQDQAEALIALGMAVAGLIAVFFPDARKTHAETAEKS